METILVVVQAFGAYALGDRISDNDEGREILSGEQSTCVVRVQSSDPDLIIQEV